MKTPRETLEDLGLKEKEASVYVALLELGETTVSSIAKKAKVKRSTAYVILEELGKKGLAIKNAHGKKSTYIPEHPQKLLVDATSKLAEIKLILPFLESTYRKDADTPRILIYEDKDELDNAYIDFFRHKGEVFYIGNIELALSTFEKSYEKISQTEIHKKILLRQIVDDSSVSREYAKKHDGKLTQTKFIPKDKMPFETDIGIFGDKVIITSVKGKLFSVSIEAKEIAHAFRVIFEIMWKAL